MTSLEEYLITVVLLLVVAVLFTLWKASAPTKEPTYRIRESYQLHGYPKYMAMVYIGECKGRFGLWWEVCCPVRSFDSAEWNLRGYINEKLKKEEKREVKYFDSLGNTLL